MKKNCWLIGAGYMALEYIRVLKKFDIDLTVIGRGKERVKHIVDNQDIKAVAGGLDNYIKEGKFMLPQYAIIAVPVEELMNVTIQLITLGVKNILVEKPGGLTQRDIDLLLTSSTEAGVNLCVAYNRRFYESVNVLKQKAREDGGIISVHFEFTEWIHTIDPSKYSTDRLKRWIIANSTHVIDTAFHLMGRPAKLNANITGEGVPWHPAGSVFVGSGVAKNDILFSYHSNWDAPGRWGIEVCTFKRKYYLKPLERLAIQEKGSVTITDYQADYSIDIDYKAGLFKMTRAFLDNDLQILCSIQEHQLNFNFYEKIANYLEH